MTSRAKTNVVAALIMIALFAALFLPYFSLGEGASLVGYLAMPSDYPQMEAAIAGVIDGYTVNDIVAPLILLQTLALAGGALMFFYREKEWISLFGIAFGITGLCTFLGCPALALGGSMVRGLYIAISIIVLLMSSITTAGTIRELTWERKVEALEAQMAQQRKEEEGVLQS